MYTLEGANSVSSSLGDCMYWRQTWLIVRHEIAEVSPPVSETAGALHTPPALSSHITSTAQHLSQSSHA
jgi:hypothetical protein